MVLYIAAFIDSGKAAAGFRSDNINAETPEAKHLPLSTPDPQIHTVGLPGTFQFETDGSTDVSYFVSRSCL